MNRKLQFLIATTTNNTDVHTVKILVRFSGDLSKGPAFATSREQVLRQGMDVGCTGRRPKHRFKLQIIVMGVGVQGVLLVDVLEPFVRVGQAARKPNKVSYQVRWFFAVIVDEGVAYLDEPEPEINADL